MRRKSTSGRKSAGSCDAFTDLALKADIFGKPFQFNLNEKNDKKQKSMVGLLASSVFFLVLILFASFRIFELKNQNEI